MIHPGLSNESFELMFDSDWFQNGEILNPPIPTRVRLWILPYWLLCKIAYVHLISEPEQMGNGYFRYDAKLISTDYILFYCINLTKYFGKKKG